MTFKLTDPQRQGLAHFLKNRYLKAQAINLLKEAKKRNQLKQNQLKTAQTLTYAEITDGLETAIASGWMSLDDVVRVLDTAEISGKQHVCIFRLPTKGTSSILNTLRTPTGTVSATPSIADFYSVPSSSSVRVLVDSPDEVAVKIVTRRAYWITNMLEQDSERELIERKRHRERSAVILKCNRKTGFVQLRVPPREKGSGETAKGVYDFAVTALTAHYPVDLKSWFHKIDQFAIADSFPKLLANKTEFELWYDSPEDHNTKTRISRKGRPKHGNDLRTDKNWRFEKGYARTSLRGFWKCPSTSHLYVHMNSDQTRLSKSTTRKFARIFVPDLCSDGDLDHVIQRIHDHI